MTVMKTSTGIHRRRSRKGRTCLLTMLQKTMEMRYKAFSLHLMALMTVKCDLFIQQEFDCCLKRLACSCRTKMKRKMMMGRLPSAARSGSSARDLSTILRLSTKKKMMTRKRSVEAFYSSMHQLVMSCIPAFPAPACFSSTAQNFQQLLVDETRRSLDLLSGWAGRA